jgi:hypothetical protein
VGDDFKELAPLIVETDEAGNSCKTTLTCSLVVAVFLESGFYREANWKLRQDLLLRIIPSTSGKLNLTLNAFK